MSSTPRKLVSRFQEGSNERDFATQGIDQGFDLRGIEPRRLGQDLASRSDRISIIDVEAEGSTRVWILERAAQIVDEPRRAREQGGIDRDWGIDRGWQRREVPREWDGGWFETLKGLKERFQSSEEEPRDLETNHVSNLGPASLRALKLAERLEVEFAIEEGDPDSLPSSSPSCFTRHEAEEDAHFRSASPAFVFACSFATGLRTDQTNQVARVQVPLETRASERSREVEFDIELQLVVRRERHAGKARLGVHIEVARVCMRGRRRSVASSSPSQEVPEVVPRILEISEVVDNRSHGSSERSDEVFAKETENGVYLAVHRASWQMVRTVGKVRGHERRLSREHLFVCRDDLNVFDRRLVVVVSRTSDSKRTGGFEEPLDRREGGGRRRRGRNWGRNRCNERNRLGTTRRLAEHLDLPANAVNDETMLTRVLEGSAVERGRVAVDIGRVLGEVLL